jgi:hypothetical protein
MFNVICVTLDDLLGCVAFYNEIFRMIMIAYIALHDYHMTLIWIHIMYV